MLKYDKEIKELLEQQRDMLEESFTRIMEEKGCTRDDAVRYYYFGIFENRGEE